MNYKLSPSDLTFLYDGCKHCFVLKVKHGISQPSIPLPGVFSVIASLQKDHYSGKRTEDFCPQLPPGIVTLGEKRVQSIPIKFDDLENPAQGALKLSPISRMGLLYFTPDSCEYTGNDCQVLGGRMSWHEVKRDDAAFHKFLHAVVALLDGPLPEAET